MTGSQKFRIEVSIKLVGLFIAAFAIFKYFNDQHVAREYNQTSRALEYVNEYRGKESVEQRVNLANFWLSHSQLAQALSERRLSSENYRNLLLAVVRSDGKPKVFWRSVLVQNQFFDELALCHQRELCSQETVEAFFCGHVKSFGIVYRPATEILAERLGNSNFGSGAQMLAEECTE